jgi:hypothetical protein
MSTINRRLPKIDVRDLREDYAEFLLSNTDASMANALRRVMLVEARTPHAACLLLFAPDLPLTPVACSMQWRVARRRFTPCLTACMHACMHVTSGHHACDRLMSCNVPQSPRATAAACDVAPQPLLAKMVACGQCCISLFSKRKRFLTGAQVVLINSDLNPNTGAHHRNRPGGDRGKYNSAERRVHRAPAGAHPARQQRRVRHEGGCPRPLLPAALSAS